MSRTASARTRSTDPDVPRRNGQPRVLSRGDLRLLVLALIGEQPRHGYELMQLISNQFMQAYTPSAGTMYPLLASFEQAGWIEAEEVDGKRIFRITAAGEFELKVQRAGTPGAATCLRPCPRDHQGPLPPPLATALREFKRALVHHHGRWAEGEADEVAALLTRASALLNGTAGSEQPPISTTQPD